MSVVKRLPRYFRYLGELSDKGVTRVSSKDLSRLMDITASQIRQDLNNFGCFGQQGYGYNVEMLKDELAKILGLTRVYKLVIIGAGNLGQALVSYSRFAKRGFEFIGMFDIAPELIGREISGLTIMHINGLKAFLNEKKPDIAVFCLPGESVRDVLDIVIESGVEGIWTFSHLDLKNMGGVKVQSVHLTDSLMTLSYMLNEEKS
jgi:redox-sensing transcriptional repressor